MIGVAIMTITLVDDDNVKFAVRAKEVVVLQHRVDEHSHQEDVKLHLLVDAGGLQHRACI